MKSSGVEMEVLDPRQELGEFQFWCGRGMEASDLPMPTVL